MAKVIAPLVLVGKAYCSKVEQRVNQGYLTAYRVVHDDDSECPLDRLLAAYDYFSAVHGSCCGRQAAEMA